MHSDGHDAPWLVDEFVPCVAAVVEDIVVGFEDPVREPVVAHELPDVLLWVEFRTFRGQRHERDVRRDNQPARQMPAGLIEQEDGVLAGRDLGGDFSQVQGHRLAVASGEDEGCTFPFLRTDRAEDIGRGGALVVGRRRPGSSSGPASRDLVLLADARLVGEPDFYIGRVDTLAFDDLCHTGGKAFLKSSIAPSACA